MEVVSPEHTRKLRRKYILTDLVCLVLTWFIVNYVRHNFFGVYTTPTDVMYWVFLVLFLMGWVGLYALAGCYNHPHHRSRMTDLILSFSTSIIGCVILLFVMIINDTVNSYSDYIETFFVLFSVQFLFSFIPRVSITSHTMRRFDRYEICFPTIILGSGKNALMVKEAIENHHSNGMFIDSLVDASDKIDMEALLRTIETKKIKNAIIAPDEDKLKLVRDLMPALFECGVNVFVLADTYDIAIGGMSALDLYSVPLISMARHRMPQWQKNVKWVMDKFAAIFAIIVFSPVLLYSAYKIKKGSPGPIFYRQTRIGLKGRPFKIFKFRSMYVSNEQNSAIHLTKDDDPRIVGKWGHTMRKYRIDELPQFFNVLKGDMSMVGFRPEQPYFVQQLIERDPHYAMLYCMRPGITSWGMVKYGYAENVDEMLRRAQYDYLYLDNGSLAIDIKIAFYTIKTIVTGKGK